MAAKKGQSKPEYSDKQKAEIVEQVCALYESQHSTIESCCNAAGVAVRTFALWRSQNAEFAERYKKAKEVQDENYWQEIIRPLAKTALQRHLEAEEVEDETEVVYQGEKTGETQRTVKRVLPNPTITIFATKGIYPKMFTDKIEHSGPEGEALPGQNITLVFNAPNVQPITSEEAMQAILDKYKDD